MMSSESPPSSASCTVISEVHDNSPAAIEYSSAATLKLPHRGRSNSSSEDDNKTIPPIGFIDPSVMNIPITVPPTRSVDDEDEIIIETPISVATQTETDVDAIIYTNKPEEIQVDPSPDKLEQKHQNECGLTCLYYAMQCCDCVIM